MSTTFTIDTSTSRATPVAAHASRLPAGHPEGYLEAFANLYADIADVIGGDCRNEDRIPGLSDGLSGMAFIAAAQASGARDGAWVEVRP